jgi:hypothetical protein
MTTITTQNGTELELCPVSSYYITGVRNKARSDFIKENGALLTPPTYTIVCGGGPGFTSWEETKTHKEDTIEQGTESEKHAWTLYQEQQRELGSFIWMRTARVYLLRGVTTEPPDNGWQARQERDNIEVPTDPEDRKQHWIETEAVINPFELGMVVTTIQAQSQQVKEAREQAAEMFRRAMELA